MDPFLPFASITPLSRGTGERKAQLLVDKHGIAALRRITSPIAVVSLAGPKTTTERGPRKSQILEQIMPAYSGYRPIPWDMPPNNNANFAVVPACLSGLDGGAAMVFVDLPPMFSRFNNTLDPVFLVAARFLSSVSHALLALSELVHGLCRDGVSPVTESHPMSAQVSPPRASLRSLFGHAAEVPSIVSCPLSPEAQCP